MGTERIQKEESATAIQNASVTTSLFRNILVATDFSNSCAAAVHDATRWALKSDAELTLMHVFEYGDAVAPAARHVVSGLLAIQEKAQRQLE